MLSRETAPSFFSVSVMASAVSVAKASVGFFITTEKLEKAASASSRRDLFSTSRKRQQNVKEAIESCLETGTGSDKLEGFGAGRGNVRRDDRFLCEGAFDSCMRRQQK